MVKLSVNVDHVANIREARKTVEPDPIAAAIIAELAGAHGITVHLRSDRRHIQERDLYLLRQVIKGELNLEMAATPEMYKIACKVKPHWVTLVPESPGEITTQGGLNCDDNKKALHGYIKSLHQQGFKVSLFIDPDDVQLRAAQSLAIEAVEIHTGIYAEEKEDDTRLHELNKVANAIAEATKLGLIARAGHGLTYQNVQPIARIDSLSELSIGHSVIAKAVIVGMDKAVRDMLSLINQCTK